MILIAGSGQLPIAIRRRLHAMGAEVKRVVPDHDGDQAFASEDLCHASVLVLADDNDSGNVDLVLQARQVCPDLPLVVRIFDSTLTAYLFETISTITILSMSKVAAPVFAEASLRVLRAPQAERPARPVHPNAAYARPRSYRVDRILVGALLSLFLLVFPSALFFSHVLKIRYMDALYFVWTTVMTVGYGDIALKDAGDGTKLFGMGLMLAGASFIAVLFALLSDWVLSRRLDVLNGRIRVRNKRHVVIAGAGNIGLRIAGILAADGQRLVIIEKLAASHNVAVLRAAGHHVIVADATYRDTLALAGIESATLVLAVTDIDAVNLQIALHAREMGVPVIMRVESAALSVHVSERGDGIAYAPVVSAAEAFARASMSVAAGATGSDPSKPSQS
jgi:Trk K+ transport system NAD-binding subunit